jgi:hypothetical protein
LYLLVIGGLAPLELPRFVGPLVFWLGFIGPLMVGAVASVFENSDERKKSIAAFMAFGAQRGLAPETLNAVGGVVGELRVRFELQFVGRRNNHTPSKPTHLVLSAYGPHSAHWPGETSVTFDSSGPGWDQDLPTAVSPQFDGPRFTRTRFPVPAVSAVGQRLDGPHYQALPHHRRLGYLPLHLELQARLLQRDWMVSVYAGRIQLRGKISEDCALDYEQSLALCELISGHMATWAALVQKAQAGATQAT